MTNNAANNNTAIDPQSLDAATLLSTPLSALVAHNPLCLEPEATIQEGAQAMRKAGVSSVLLIKDGFLQGIVTDRDLRNRVVAEGLSASLPLTAVATTRLRSLPSRASALDAMTLMARRNIHHVPVVDDGRVVGIVTPRDVGERQSPSPVQLARSIHAATSIEALTKLSAQVPSVQQSLVRSGAQAQDIGRIITTFTDAVTVRIIALAQKELGTAPVPWVWVAAGSQARMEQTARTDQDNCMILSDEYDPKEHGEYFERFARFVCDGLNTCGYVHCPGEMMAMTDKWRQPLERWRSYFRKWIDEPEPMALMLSSVFFDLRAVDGHKALLKQLRKEEISRASNSKLFLGHMVGNALKQRPPLGWFGGISPIRSGDHSGTIDLKHSAIAPIVDLARIYSLSAGQDEVNTQDRLDAAGAATGGEVSQSAAQDLRGALEFLSALRLEHQAKQVSQDKAPDNYLPVASLTHFERLQLRQAFKVIKEHQAVVGRRYQMGR